MRTTNERHHRGSGGRSCEAFGEQQPENKKPAYVPAALRWGSWSSGTCGIGVGEETCQYGRRRKQAQLGSK